jgi:hypothetical protein
VTDRLEESEICKCDRPGMIDLRAVRLLGFTPVCGPPARHSLATPDDPAMGFASRRVVGHASASHDSPSGSTAPGVQPAGLDPGSGSPASGFSRVAPACAAVASSLSAHGFSSSRSLRYPRAIRDAGPFSVLMGLMPVRPDPDSRPVNQADSLSEVPHRP